MQYVTFDFLIPIAVTTNESVDLNVTANVYAFSYTWDFDDGIVLWNITDNITVNHTWTKAGYYNVTVTGNHVYGNQIFAVRSNSIYQGFPGGFPTCGPRQFCAAREGFHIFAEIMK